MKWIRRNWPIILGLAGCVTVAVSIILGGHLSWPFQLLWIGITALWIGNTVILQATIEVQRQHIELLKQRRNAWLS